jgi:hypothetical protein
MANTNSTDALVYLGKTVHLVHHGRNFEEDLNGRVLAVVVPVPGAPVGTSLLLDLPGGCEYVDLEDCRLISVN